VKVVGLHAGVLVATSRVFQTACTIIRDGDECLVVDSPVLPDELDVLPALLDQAGFPFSGLLATHADWDHLLGRLAFPDAALGVAETTAARLSAEPGDAARRLRAFDDELYLERSAPLSLGHVQALPVPGHLDVGAQTIELHPTEGHVVDGMALWLDWAAVLVAGDFLSPVEIPMISRGGSRSAYLATLERLRPLVEQADHVVAGHGGAIDGVRALAILREDVAYLEGLPDSKLPIARRSAEQKRIHGENLERL
jgi:glyoxylase-like metal-dependent hydrolase (beta-lactamase superfamily II)